MYKHTHIELYSYKYIHHPHPQRKKEKLRVVSPRNVTRRGLLSQKKARAINGLRCIKEGKRSAWEDE